MQSPVGPSSGLNYCAAIEMLRRLNDPAAQVVTVFPDGCDRYLGERFWTEEDGS